MIKQWLVSYKFQIVLIVCFVLLFVCALLNFNGKNDLHKNTTALNEKNSSLQSENSQLRQDVEQLHEENAQLEQEAEESKKRIEELEKEKSELLAKRKQQQATLIKLSNNTTISKVSTLPEGEYPEARLIWNTIKSWGYSDNVVAGIIGNMMAEVGGGTLAGLSNWHTDGCGYGLIQWTSGRQRLLKQLYGARPNIEQQLQFIKNELTGQNGVNRQVTEAQYNELLNAGSPEAAAMTFAKYYERCGSSYRAKRQTFARTAYNYFVG
nr:MAG TPA: Morphogenesis protein 1 wall, phi29, hydrolase, infection [Caudoviricetes sp.]